MEDIRLAKKLLKEENLTMVLVKEGKCFYKSRERGIKPLYIALTEYKEEIKGASAADKILGKGAALLYIKGEVKTLYAQVISETALVALEENDINVFKGILVPYIKNRDETGMCPIETMAIKDDNIDSLLKRIEIFLKNNNLI